MYYVTGTINEYTYDWATLNHAVERQRQLRATGLKSPERKDWPSQSHTTYEYTYWSDERKK